MQHHRLCQVVGGVSHHHRGGPHVAGHLGQEPITCLPGGLLKGGAIGDVTGTGVPLYNRRWKAHLFGYRPDKPRVFLRLLPSEIVVKMGYVQPKPVWLTQTVQA
jgi:hypothetical protein